eukprot:gene6365-biopygen5410
MNVTAMSPKAISVEVVEAIAARQPAQPGALQLVAFAKAYGGLTDDEFKAVDRVIRQTTLEKFGPVRSVRPTMVFELGFEGINASDAAKGIAASLLSGDQNVKNKAVFLGNAAAAHPQASALHAAAQWIAEQTGAKLGYLVDAANTVGGYLVNATAKNAAPAFSAPKKFTG